MNDTPVSNRLHIGIFGRRNAGKSSLINALTGQKTAIVDETPGTTTDPVGKAMEIPGIGPVFIYDTAGIDDTGLLGEKRVQRTKEIINKINLAIIVASYNSFGVPELALIEELKKKTDAVLVFFNKKDTEQKVEGKEKAAEKKGVKHVSLSCETMEGLDEAKKLILEESKKITVENATIVGDLIKPGTYVVLVVPIDLGAPKGRLILPQVQIIRDILDNDAY
ncbi:MAG TPA: GTP-binding protein, partial [Firmicutes bacterium]|nr:GTP-binding protein [Bacillota bacterium]